MCTAAAPQRVGGQDAPQSLLHTGVISVCSAVPGRERTLNAAWWASVPSAAGVEDGCGGGPGVLPQVRPQRDR